MRRPLPAIAAVLLVPAVALAQTAPGPLPRAFAGYGQPTVTAAMCRSASAAETRCQIPAMTAGRYLIEAAGTSTAQGADAKQALEIDIGAVPCGLARPADRAPWTSGPRTFKVDCETTLLTDTPLTIRAVYADFHAVKDPRGPVLTITSLPWSGVIGSRMFPPAAPSQRK